MSDRLEIGAKVRSKKVGPVPAFDGVITDVLTSQYVVLDEAKKQAWCRTKHELEVRS